MSNLLIITQKINKNDQNLGFFHRWVEEFSNHFEKITVICLEKGEFRLPENVRVLSLGKEEGRSRVKYIFNFYKYIWRERKNYDSVFVHMNQAYILLAGLIWRLLRKKIYLWYTHKKVNLSLIVAEKICNGVFSASRESFRIASSKLKIVGHGIDTDFFAPLDIPKKRSVYTILSAGRISPTKNQMIMAEVLRVLKQKNFNAKFVIIGGPIMKEDFAYEKMIKEYVEENDLEDRIQWVGPVKPESMAEYYRDADLFINLSQSGSIDKAVLEAMASGLQILTSNEAFHPVLAPINLVDNDSENISRSIISLSRAKVSPDMRKYVLENHQLKSLIKNMSNIIKK